MLLEILSLFALVGLSAFFSGSETALFALQDPELEELEQLSTPGARRAVGLAQRPYRTLVTLLLSNMVVNVGLSTISTALLLDALGPAGLGVAIPAITVVLLLFGEILPKTVGLRYRRRLAPLAAPLVDLLATLLTPLRAGLEWLAARLSGTPRPASLSRGELETLMEVAREEGVFSRFEGRVLRRVLRFSELSVERALTPRVDVVGLPREAGVEEAIRLFERSGRSRVPVYQDSLDQVVGVLYLKDILTAPGPRESLELGPLLREPWFVPESKPCGELFAEFQERRIHLAMVVGEHGGMEGIVTLEDLLEEIIGDVQDESDEDLVQLESLGPGRWRVDAGIELDDLGEALGLELEEHEDSVTLAGLLEEELGRVPRTGDTVHRLGHRFLVLTARPNRPLLVKVEKVEEER